MALIDLLVGAHNEFIEKCQSHLKDMVKTGLVDILLFMIFNIIKKMIFTVGFFLSQ